MFNAKVVSLALAMALLSIGVADAKWKKPGWVSKAQKSSQEALDSTKRAVKGQAVISVYNQSDEAISVWSSTGNENIEIAPRKTGKLKKTDIGSDTMVEVNDAPSARMRWRAGMVVQNHIDLVFNGTDLKRK